MSEQNYRVPDVSCEHCIRAINDELMKLSGVHQVDVNLETKMVTVMHDESVSEAQIRAGIAEAGYDIAA